MNANTVAPRIEMDTVRSGYIDLCHAIRDHGRSVEPRGQACRELTGATLVVHDPMSYAMPVGLNRRLNLAIGACEALQLIAGVSTPELLCRIAPNFARFRDGEAFYGAYGPRVAAALRQVHRQLIDDPDTRQAIASVWRAEDAWAETRDLPCTLGFQFLLRDDALELHTTMRSNDVWWGWSYDAFQFTRLQQAMAAALGVAVGPYVHRAGSLHLYDRDLAGVDELTPVGVMPGNPDGLLIGANDWVDCQVAATQLLAGGATSMDVGGWYTRTLAGAVPS
jgi:thymidylate synthase